jgi:tyrosyl-tRNA synthetase
MIGDPSGRNSERSALESDAVSQNAEKIAGNLRKVFENHGKLLWDSKKGAERLSDLM